MTDTKFHVFAKENKPRWGVGTGGGMSDYFGPMTQEQAVDLALRGNIDWVEVATLVGDELRIAALYIKEGALQSAPIHGAFFNGCNNELPVVKELNALLAERRAA